MPFATQSSTLYLLEKYGRVEPSVLLGPVRQGLVRFGDGPIIEEGTTNLLTNPAFEAGAGATGWVQTPTASTAFGVSTARAYLGTQSLRTVSNGTGAGGFTRVTVNPTVSNTVTYTFSGYVYLDGYAGQAKAEAIAGAVPFTSGATVNVPANTWTRVSVTVTANADGAATFQFSVQAANGQIFYIDAAQLEAKNSATSYCDGSLATAWNAPGALYTEDFETVAFGGWGGTGVTVGTTTTNPYSGTRALVMTTNTTANSFAFSPFQPVTVGKTYSASVKMRANTTARNALCTIAWYDAAGTLVSVADGPSRSTVVGSYLTFVSTGVAPANATQARVFANGSTVAPAAGETINVDAVRFSEGSDAAAYYWTGAENASTSVRVLARNTATLPSSLAGPLTVAGVFRAGQASSAGTPRYVFGLPASGTVTPNCYYQGTSFVFSSGLDVSASLSMTIAAGDIIAFVAVLAADGKTYSLYASQNGGTVVSTTTAASATAYGGGSTIGIGDLAGSSATPLNGAIEQLLAYKRALTGPEATALLNATSPAVYTDDTAIVLAAATGDARGVPQALTSAGTGSYRALRSVPCFAEDVTPNGASPDDDGATKKFTVDAGTGAGVGQAVTINSPTGGNVYTVLKVTALPGLKEELLCA